MSTTDQQELRHQCLQARGLFSSGAKNDGILQTHQCSQHISSYVPRAVLPALVLGILVGGGSVPVYLRPTGVDTRFMETVQIM